MKLAIVDRVLLLHPEIYDLDMSFPAFLCHSCGQPQDDGEEWNQYPSWISYQHYRGHTPPFDSTGLVVVPVEEVALVTLCPVACADRAVADAEWSCVPFEMKVTEG